MRQLQGNNSGDGDDGKEVWKRMDGVVAGMSGQGGRGGGLAEVKEQKEAKKE